MESYSLFDIETDISNWRVSTFSANNFCNQTERLRLEDKYFPITQVTDKFNRQNVSFQLSKSNCLHRWLKYKEGFSAELVNILLDEFKITERSLILDPFMGSGTTAMACKIRGIDSIGFDILPMSLIAIKAKQAVFDYNVSELRQLILDIDNLSLPCNYDHTFEYLSITDGAFPTYSAKEIPFFTEWIKKSTYSNDIKNLALLGIINSLETISYTAKDGQYLRWDYRSPKMISANADRLNKGKRPIVVRLDKGTLPTLQETLSKELKNMYTDICLIQQQNRPTHNATIHFSEGSTLAKMPELPDSIIDGVITSPPYCNRYDYTRTYALEMNYLGISKERMNELRQSLLSCTVENKSKLEYLQQIYHTIKRDNDYETIHDVIKSNKTLNEILTALQQRNTNGDINNKGVIRMIEGYFTELAFIYFELFRLCKKGAKVAFVNDNVRYAGEVIPVDFLSTEIAEQIGFKPLKVYALKQQKGNSSQQMKKFGRIALRKSITIWEK